jgi:hypothetical protein
MEKAVDRQWVLLDLLLASLIEEAPTTAPPRKHPDSLPFPRRSPGQAAASQRSESSTRRCSLPEQQKGARGMGDHELRGDDFVKKADQKLSG